MAMNYAMNAATGSHGNQHRPNNNNLMGIAGQFLHSGKPNQTSHSSSAGAGGLVGGLVGSLVGGKPTQQHQQPTSWTGQPQQQQQQQGGVFGMVTGMFGGSAHNVCIDLLRVWTLS